MNRKLMSVAMRGMVSAVVMAVMCGCADENRPGTSVTGHIAASIDLDSKAITSKGRSADEAAVSVGDLAVSIVAEDGSYSHTWASVDQFPTDQEFNVGRYTLTAFYGAATDEGFEKPYYYGETQVNVVADRTTAATLTATLANAMVSVDYT
ncbi:MAG: DUF4493 domain-containing protein, partial [Muribaculaceae bacterium]|nr:DUF4493 domain-containing protein [Muribaculaceae bacterium]